MYVTDTHALVHYIRGRHSRLGKESRRAFQQAEKGNDLIYIPAAVLWELVSPSSPLLDPSQRFDRWCLSLKNTGLVIHPLEWEDINEAHKLPFPDPFDCLIVGAALRLDLPLITKDSIITDSGLVETIW